MEFELKQGRSICQNCYTYAHAQTGKCFAPTLPLRKTKGQCYVSITGRSMFLIIRENDRVLVSLGWMGIRRGNVIVFRHEGMLIAHRVLRDRENGYRAPPDYKRG